MNELLNESKNCAIHKKNEWKVPFLDRTGPFCLFFTVFHCFLKLWFVFKFEWIISLNEYFWFNFEWIILLNEYSRFNFELNIELNHFLARFNVKMNNQNLSATPSQHSQHSAQLWAGSCSLLCQASLVSDDLQPI